MTRVPISILEFCVKPVDLWEVQWLLLTCGDYASGDYNAMTVGWGSLGRMWSKPFAQVVVRPNRYTFGFMERFDTFTLCAFPEAYRAALDLLGTKSGRDGDKISETNLTPIASKAVKAPGYAEAELILECRKIYWQDMDNSHFLVSDIEEKYPGKHYHRIFYGEILAIEAVKDIWGSPSS
jgi:flavin reductase (DIM6/NTAB) family NADH-FMN oxidoreductase RutF